MTTWHRVQGDTDDTIVVTLNGVADLDAVTAVEAHVWRTGTAAETLAASVTDAEAREVTVDLGDWITDADPGTWSLEVQATIAGNPVTWPAGTPDRIVVRAQGA